MWLPASTALPTPMNTSTNVPTNSARYFLIALPPLGEDSIPAMELYAAGTAGGINPEHYFAEEAPHTLPGTTPPSDAALPRIPPEAHIQAPRALRKCPPANPEHRPPSEAHTPEALEIPSASPARR